MEALLSTGSCVTIHAAASVAWARFSGDLYTRGCQRCFVLQMSCVNPGSLRVSHLHVPQSMSNPKLVSITQEPSTEVGG